MTKYLPFLLDKYGYHSYGRSPATYALFLIPKWAPIGYANNCPALGDEGRELRKIFFEKLPVPPISAKTKATHRSAGIAAPPRDTAEQEAEIDRLVYTPEAGGGSNDTACSKNCREKI